MILLHFLRLITGRLKKFKFKTKCISIDRKRINIKLYPEFTYYNRAKIPNYNHNKFYKKIKPRMKEEKYLSRNGLAEYY